MVSSLLVGSKRLSLLWTSEGEDIIVYHFRVCSTCIHAKLNNGVFCWSESTDQESMSMYVVGSVCDLAQSTSMFIVAARNKTVNVSKGFPLLYTLVTCRHQQYSYYVCTYHTEQVAMRAPRCASAHQ